MGNSNIPHGRSRNDFKSSHRKIYVSLQNYIYFYEHCNNFSFFFAFGLFMKSGDKIRSHSKPTPVLGRCLSEAVCSFCKKEKRASLDVNITRNLLKKFSLFSGVEKPEKNDI